MPAGKLQFPSIQLALSFVRELTPWEPVDAWRSLEGLTIHYGDADQTAALEVAEPKWPAMVGEKLILRFGARWMDLNDRRNWPQSVAMQKFFEIVQLVRNPKTERTLRCLVIQRSADAKLAAELIIDLANAEGWSIWFRELRDGGTIYELDSADGLLKIPPYGLPGQPIVLIANDDDVFVPPGWEHPFLPSFRNLMPPSEPNSIHAWLPGFDDSAKYKRLTKSTADAHPLIGAISLHGRSAPTVEFATGGTSQVKVPLRLRSTTRRRDIRQAHSYVYRVESRYGQFGPALLNLFDRAEARIENFKYFSHAHGEGPNALIEHYLFSESRVADEDFWPELERFDLPRSLREAGLQLFIPASAEFLPNLDGLFADVSAADSFVEEFRQQVGLPEGNTMRRSLVEPFGDDGHWRVIVLEGEQELYQLLQPVLGEMNREPLRQVIDVARVDLTADRRQYEEQWQDIGKQEAQELVECASQLLLELKKLAETIDGELSRLNERLGEAQEVSRSAVRLVTDLPAGFDEFARRVSEWLTFVAAPRRNWLLSTENRGRVMKQVALDLRTLETNAQQLVNSTVADANSARTDLESRRQNLTVVCQALGNSETALDAEIQKAEEAAKNADREIASRAQRVEKKYEEARQRELGVNREVSRVDVREREVIQFEVAVQNREREVAAREQALNVRRQKLENREQEAKRREQNARQESESLRILETITIPDAEQRLKEAERQLVEIRSRGIEGRFNKVSRKIEKIEGELKQAREREQGLLEREKQFLELERQLQDLENKIEDLGPRVESLTAMNLDASIAQRRDELANLNFQLKELLSKDRRRRNLNSKKLKRAMERATQAQGELQALIQEDVKKPPDTQTGNSEQGGGWFSGFFGRRK